MTKLRQWIKQLANISPPARLRSEPGEPVTPPPPPALCSHANPSRQAPIPRRSIRPEPFRPSQIHRSGALPDCRSVCSCFDCFLLAAMDLRVCMMTTPADDGYFKVLCIDLLPAPFFFSNSFIFSHVTVWPKRDAQIFFSLQVLKCSRWLLSTLSSWDLIFIIYTGVVCFCLLKHFFHPNVSSLSLEARFSHFIAAWPIKLNFIW